jgi:carboxypeptidase C (cathepsin A)
MKVALLFATILSVARTAIEADKMTFLPVPLSETGENVTLKDSMYSGYLNISETKSLHYVFVGSRSENAATDPVVIWFNGGPGCSSLLGLFQEHGPMVIEDNTTALIENPYPWNKEANMLYLESPAGVGFSVNTNESLAPAFSDMSQSIDAFAALEVWYAGFSEFMGNPLFVSGESYAGVYVPYLSWQIYENNLKAEWNTTLKTYNLTGFLVGNGCTNWDFDTAPSDPETFANMQLIPP